MKDLWGSLSYDPSGIHIIGEEFYEDQGGLKAVVFHYWRDDWIEEDGMVMQRVLRHAMKLGPINTSDIPFPRSTAKL